MVKDQSTEDSIQQVSQSSPRVAEPLCDYPVDSRFHQMKFHEDLHERRSMFASTGELRTTF